MRSRRQDQVVWTDAVEKTPTGLKGSARSITRALGLGGPTEPEYPAAVPFGDLPICNTMKKYRELSKMFGLTNPFYRIHEGRQGDTTVHEGRTLINYASFDYLSLNQEPAVAEAAKAAIDELGTSVTASRLVSGERRLHQILEKTLADLYHADDCITYCQGHTTNVSTIGVLMSPDDLIVYDDLMHNSGIVGARLSRATTIAFRHNNLSNLEKTLSEHRGKHKNALVLTEGLYSMDGDFPDLPRLIEIKKRFGCWLMIDEAHSLGVLGKTGRGIAEHYGVDPREVDIWMGVISKTLVSCGGFICGHKDLIEILRYHSPSFVYSVGLPPAATAAALAALEVIKADPERVHRLRENGHLFLQEAKKAGLDTMTSAGYSVVPIMIGCSIRSVRLSERLLARGINALPIIHPAVPMKAARVRFFINSRHTPDQIRNTVAIVAEELAGIAKKQSLIERATLAVVARD